MDAKLGLAVVGGGTSEVNRDTVRGDDVREMKEAVEMSLGRKGYHNHCHSRLCHALFHIDRKSVV